MMKEYIKPLEAIEVSIKYWWLLVVFMVCGALGGYLIDRVIPPVYESQTKFSMTIDYVATGKLTDIEEDQIIMTAGDVISSSEVIENTINAAQQQGIQLTADDFRKSIYIERTNSEWIMRVRSSQPDFSTKLVNLWAAQADLTLKEGLKHAYAANMYHRQLGSLASCVEQVASVEPAGANCGYASFKDLSESMQSLAEKARSEMDQSKGLSSALLIQWTNRAEAEGKITGVGLSSAILLGALTGLVIFIFMSSLTSVLIKH